jgi:hypothetical protein
MQCPASLGTRTGHWRTGALLSLSNATPQQNASFIIYSLVRRASNGISTKRSISATDAREHGGGSWTPI